VDPLITHYCRTLSSFLGLELWEKKHLARPHSDKNSTIFTTSAFHLCFAACSAQ